MRWTGLRIALAVLGALVVGLAAAVLLLGAGGIWERYSARSLESAAQRRGAPAWTRACRLRSVDPTTKVCARVKGRIVWVEHHDDDGDGDRHLLVAARLGIHVVKVPLNLGVGSVPGRGTLVTAVGFDRVGGSGRREVLAERLETPGRIYVLPRP